jgi:hypothetical protein
MVTLGTLLGEIFEKDDTILIEQAAFSDNVTIRNSDGHIYVENKTLSNAITDVWNQFYGKEANYGRGYDSE